MKRTIICALAFTTALGLAACNNADNARSGTSNSGPEKNSLPSPDQEYGVDSNIKETTVMYNGLGNYRPHARTMLPETIFWTAAAQGGIAEVELSKVAEARASDPEVKNFAQMMIADHTKANAELQSLAQKKNVTLPTSMSSANQAALTQMQGLTGADFDRRYVEAMITNHEADVQLFESQAQDESDPDAKAFAAKTLPTLQRHLQMIRLIQERMR